jgi:hypothetical protein
VRERRSAPATRPADASSASGTPTSNSADCRDARRTTRRKDTAAGSSANRHEDTGGEKFRAGVVHPLTKKSGSVMPNRALPEPLSRSASGPRVRGGEATPGTQGTQARDASGDASGRIGTHPMVERNWRDACGPQRLGCGGPQGRTQAAVAAPDDRFALTAPAIPSERSQGRRSTRLEVSTLRPQSRPTRPWVS